MTTRQLPELTVDPSLAEIVREACLVENALAELEAECISSPRIPVSLALSREWDLFVSDILAMWRAQDFVIIKGFPVSSGGAPLILASLSLGGRFKSYRGDKVVKTFRMSPWTTELSHTLMDGEFHTDLNTDPHPPAVTCIQCITPDPGARRYGANRVARLADLLAYLTAAEDAEMLRFLRDTPVTMVNDRSDAAWRGTIVETRRIRFHPATIRAAAHRFQCPGQAVEEHLSRLHEAALAVSEPFWLDPGHILFLSNHRTLHYRGECSVIFIDYPLEFLSRSIHLLHKNDEPE